MYVDSHCHLFMREFDGDRDTALARAREAGVELFVVIGYSLGSSRRAVELAEAHPDVYAAVGIHPHSAKDMTAEALTALRELAAHPKVVAIGEIGLDYYRDRSPRGAQMESFRAQIGLARNLNLPIVVHCRQAHDDTLRVLREETLPEAGGVLHCFSGTREHAEEAWGLGLFTSFSGTVTYPQAADLREVVRCAPTGSLLIETDAPYLTPQPFKGQRNEPAYVIEVARLVAAERLVSIEDIGRASTANARRLFRLNGKWRAPAAAKG